MTPNLVDAIYTAAQTHEAKAQSASDVFAYCTAVAQELKNRAGAAVESVDVLQAPPPLESQSAAPVLEVSATPYAALHVKLADDQSRSVINLWGDAATKTWLQEALRRQGSFLEKLTSITEELWGAVQRDEKPLDMACRRIVDAMPGIDRVSIMMANPNDAMGTVIAAFPTDTVGQELKLSDYTLFHQLGSTREPVVIQDVNQADDLLGPNKGLLSAFAIQSLLIIPLTVEREMIGSIGFDAIRQKHYFSEQEVVLLQSVVRQIALYLKTKTPGRSAMPTGTGELIGAMVQDVPFRSDVESILRITAERIGRRLNATSAKLYLNRTPSELDSQDVE